MEIGLSLHHITTRTALHASKYENCASFQFKSMFILNKNHNCQDKTIDASLLRKLTKFSTYKVFSRSSFSNFQGNFVRYAT